jgi:hypothetical protein
VKKFLLQVALGLVLRQLLQLKL